MWKATIACWKLSLPSLLFCYLNKLVTIFEISLQSYFYPSTMPAYHEHIYLVLVDFHVVSGRESVFYFLQNYYQLFLTFYPVSQYQLEAKARAVFTQSYDWELFYLINILLEQVSSCLSNCWFLGYPWIFNVIVPHSIV